jgi:5-methylcytosine-specific restriction protein A
VTLFPTDIKIKHSTIHDAYGGSRQSGISPSAQVRMIFLFTGSGGGQHGYRDFVDDVGVFHYYGQGQSGDMEFISGNRAIRDHVVDGKDLHLFEQTRKGYVRYLGQYVCAGYQFDDNALDSYQQRRRAIVFQLVEADQVDVSLGDHSIVTAMQQSEIDLRGTSRTELYRLATETSEHASVAATDVLHRVYMRSAAVRLYTLDRAQGVCEGCSGPAPFVTKAGTPYLEPHHTMRLSDGGPDHPRNVIALCPACHRRVHYGEDGEDYNRRLTDILRRPEH